FGTLCVSCMDQGPVQPRWRPVDVQVEQAIPDGCARFQIHANPGQTVTIDSIYGTQFCQTDELKLIQDSASVFDAATGRLRVPIVVKNVGTRAVRGLLKLRYDADSVQLFDTNGNPVPGPTTIVGLGDSTLNNGRVAYWAYNQLLAPAGEQQVLFAGQTSGRRWLELQGFDWNRTVRIKLFTTARYGDPVSISAKDSLPPWVVADINMVKHSRRHGDWFARNVVTILFQASATLAQRQAAIDSVGGIVVGGIRAAGTPDGRYLVLVASDSTGNGVFAAIDRLQRLPYVLFAGPLDGWMAADGEPTYASIHDPPLPPRRPLRPPHGATGLMDALERRRRL
ncbi:MAG: hypothetical protein U0132_23760, partial [Gemmatimonadaceae bacterium]